MDAGGGFFSFLCSCHQCSTFQNWGSPVKHKDRPYFAENELQQSTKGTQDVAVLDGTSRRISHRFDELNQPNGDVDRQDFTFESVDTNTAAKGAQDLPQVVDAHFKTMADGGGGGGSERGRWAMLQAGCSVGERGRKKAQTESVRRQLKGMQRKVDGSKKDMVWPSSW